MENMPPWQWLLFGAVIGFGVARLLGRAAVARRPPTPERPLSPDQLTRVRDLALAGHVIDAIRAHREATGSSLREAKDFVDALSRVRH